MIVAIAASIAAGCAGKRSVVTATPAPVPAGTKPPVLNHEASQALISRPYVPLQPYPFDRRLQPPTASNVWTGIAPATDDEMRQAIEAEPDSRMAKAQEVYVDEQGQRMWRYTETIQLDQDVACTQLSLSASGGHLDGYLAIRNKTGFKIMKAQVVLMCGSRPFVVIDQSAAVQLDNMTEKAFRISMPIPRDLEELRPKRLRIEAQIAGPPGLITHEEDVTERYGRVG